jgi:hypothetical protein
MLIPLLANGCGGHPSSINEKYRQLKNPFCFFLFWKTKSNFAIWFGRPIKGEVKNGRGALLPRARTRRSSGQTHTEQGHTHAYLCLYSTSILIVIIYNLSLSLSLSLSIWIAFFIVVCRLELAGMLEIFLAQFDPFPIYVLWFFFLVVAVVVVVEKEPSQNTNGWMCIEENRGEITLFSLFRFALVRTQSRQRGNESTPLLDSIALLHTLTPAVCVCVPPFPVS